LREADLVRHAHARSTYKQLPLGAAPTRIK